MGSDVQRDISLCADSMNHVADRLIRQAVTVSADKEKTTILYFITEQSFIFDKGIYCDFFCKLNYTFFISFSMDENLSVF